MPEAKALVRFWLPLRLKDHQHSSVGAKHWTMAVVATMARGAEHAGYPNGSPANKTCAEVIDGTCFVVKAFEWRYAPWLKLG